MEGVDCLLLESFLVDGLGAKEDKAGCKSSTGFSSSVLNPYIDIRFKWNDVLIFVQKWDPISLILSLCLSVSVSLSLSLSLCLCLCLSFCECLFSTSK